MKAVIDTNCLIASIPRRNPEFWLYEAFRASEFTWVISNEVLTEYAEKLAGFYSPRTAELVASILLAAENVELSEPYFKWGLMANDPDDNKFADLAISSNADYLVTNDRHFDALKKAGFPPVNVASLEDFKKILGR